jgi:hypothetical protein
MQFSPGAGPVVGGTGFIKNQALAQVLPAQAAMKNIAMFGWFLAGGCWIKGKT